MLGPLHCDIEVSPVEITLLPFFPRCNAPPPTQRHFPASSLLQHTSSPRHPPRINRWAPCFHRDCWRLFCSLTFCHTPWVSGIVLAVIRLPDPVASAGESLSENKHLLGAQCSAGRIVGGGGEVPSSPLPVNLRSGVAASFPLLSRCANCPGSVFCTV